MSSNVPCGILVVYLGEEVYVEYAPSLHSGALIRLTALSRARGLFIPYNCCAQAMLLSITLTCAPVYACSDWIKAEKPTRCVVAAVVCSSRLPRLYACDARRALDAA